MKKQFVLILLIACTLVFIQQEVSAQPTVTSAQPSNLTPRVGTTPCVDWPLHPRAGKSYTYQVENPTSDAVNYVWWATKNPNFITTSALADTTNKLEVKPGELISAGTGYANRTNTSASIEITWSPEILADTEYEGTPGGSPSPTFLAVMAIGSCTNNLQVYELNPMPSFTVDIANISPDTDGTLAYDTEASQCVDSIRGAVYNAGVIDMDYGTDTLLFEVIAANFVTHWLPTFQIMEGLNGDQTASIGWAYSIDDAKNGEFIEPEVTRLINSGTVTATTPIITTEVNTADGVSIFVRVVIDNNTYQSLTESDFKLAVDGVDESGQWDLVNDDCTDPTAPDQKDQATHVITKRPTITHDTQDDGTIDPNDLIEKNN